VAVAAKKKKRKSANSSHWGFRLAGIVLCAFFVLGLITGLSRPGHELALRMRALAALWPHHSGSALIPDGFTALPGTTPSNNGNDNAVALVRRNGGFYLLDSAGDLRGPIAPEAQPDLPILSGPAVANADTAELMRDAAVMVRAEAGLNHLVSEMAAASDGTATLFLDHPRVAVTIDVNRGAVGIQRAVRMLHLWQGHQQMLAAIDLTAPDEAIVRLRPEAFDHAGVTGAAREVAFTPPPTEVRNRHEGRGR
jgi:hypothetical protein